MSTLSEKLNNMQTLNLQESQLEAMNDSLGEIKAERQIQNDIKIEISRLTDIFNAYSDIYESTSAETSDYVKEIKEDSTNSIGELLSNSTAIEECVGTSIEDIDNAIERLIQSSEDAVELQNESMLSEKNLISQVNDDTMSVGFPEFDESVQNGFSEIAKANEIQVAVDNKSVKKLDDILEKMDDILDTQEKNVKSVEIPLTSDMNKEAVSEDKKKNVTDKKKEKKVDWIGGIGKILKKVLDPVALVGAFFVKILPYVIIAFAIIQGVFESLPAHLKVVFVTGITAMVGGIISIWALRTVGFKTLQAVIAGIFSTESGTRTMLDITRNVKEIAFALASHLAQIATEMIKRAYASIEKAFTFACRLMEVALAKAGWLIIASAGILAVLAIGALAVVAVGLIILAIGALIGGIVWLVKETLSSFLKLMKFFFSGDTDTERETKSETKMDNSWTNFTGQITKTLDDIKNAVSGIANKIGAPIEIKTKNLQEVDKQTIEKLVKPTLTPNDRYNYINNNAYTENETIRQQGNAKDEIGVKNAPNNDAIVSILNKIYERLGNLGGEDFAI